MLMYALLYVIICMLKGLKRLNVEVMFEWLNDEECDSPTCFGCFCHHHQSALQEQW